MLNDLATPFLFVEPGFATRETELHHENGETWRCLLVTFPAHVATHCAQRVFSFGERGVLRRLDYTVDIIGGSVAHYCFDHVLFDGLLVPTSRHVVSRAAEGHLV